MIDNSSTFIEINSLVQKVGLPLKEENGDGCPKLADASDFQGLIPYDVKFRVWRMGVIQIVALGVLLAHEFIRGSLHIP